MRSAPAHDRGDPWFELSEYSEYNYFQNKNENKAYVNNIDTYKVDDPVIFNENANNKKYNHCLYNNLTGKIRDIQEDSDKLYFIIHVDTFISKDDLDCVITSNEKENWSNVKIELRKYKDNPEDDDAIGILDTTAEDYREYEVLL